MKVFNIRKKTEIAPLPAWVNSVCPIWGVAFCYCFDKNKLGELYTARSGGNLSLVRFYTTLPLYIGGLFHFCGDYGSCSLSDIKDSVLGSSDLQRIEEDCTFYLNGDYSRLSPYSIVDIQEISQ